MRRVPGVNESLRAARLHILAAFMLLIVHAPLSAQDDAKAPAQRLRSMLESGPFEEVRDSVTRIAFADLLPKLRWRRSQDLHILGTLLKEKAPGHFLGPMFRGFYMAEISTDRRGHSGAVRELSEAWKAWPRKTLAPHRGHLDELLSEQYARGIPFREQLFQLNLTRYYIQLAHQLCDEHLELNEAGEAYQVLKALMGEGFAYDVYSPTKLAWMHYKYRSFAAGSEHPFLKAGKVENIMEARLLASESQDRIAEYISRKRRASRIWLDESDLSWYHDAATNIISLAYGVQWQLDSSIAHYEKMPEWMKIRNNGIYLYLADLDFRSAERQFEAVGYEGGMPAAIVSQPSAIDAYAIVTFFKGAPEQAYHYTDDYVKKYQEGRGWGLICGGAANYWNGHLEESLRNLATAEAYPEVFGNISLTRTNYDMVIHAQRSLTYEALANRLDFEPLSEGGFLADLWGAVKKFFSKLLYRFMAFISRHRATDNYLQIADRSEFLKVFYLEATGDPFQLWSIMRGLDPTWHLERVRRSRDEDPRERADRYYDYLEAAFLHEAGRYGEAKRILERDGAPLWAKADTAYEKLTIAMTEDLHIRTLEKLGEPPQRHRAELYRRYPQAALLWGHRLPVFLERGRDDALLGEAQIDTVNAVFARLKKYGFDFLDSPLRGMPVLRFNSKARDGGIVFSLRSELDGHIITEQDVFNLVRERERAFSLSTSETAKRLAYGVFRTFPRKGVEVAPAVATGTDPADEQ